MRPFKNKLIKEAAVGSCIVSLISTSTLSAQRVTDVEVPDQDQQSDTSFPDGEHFRPRAFTQEQLHNPEVDERPEDENPDFRTIEGFGNNIAIPHWGSAATPFMRLFPAAYEDEDCSPTGADRKSAREISNLLVAQEESLLNRKRASDMLWQWSQFLDHDLTETPGHDPAESFNIAVPTGDPTFDPESTGTQEIPMSRSFYVDNDGTGERQQINLVTGFIDASQVYGSDKRRADALRTLDGTGRLRVTVSSEHGELLPLNDQALDNAGGINETLFVAGDVRVNEHVGLTAMHTLFMREHNFRANQFQSEHPQATGDQIYLHARKIVAAEIQAITYNEYLPLLLGHRSLPRYKGYDPHVRPEISNEFATAAFKFSHSLLSPVLLRLDANGDEIAAGNLTLAQASFKPHETADEGIEVTLRGLATQPCQELDELVISEVRDLLFGPSEAGGLDLPALIIQQGRDHGLPDYNSAREQLQIHPAKKFTDISRNPNTVARLEAAYSDIDDMDMWTAGLAEDAPPHSGSMLGTLFHKIVADQFRRLRDGDRFFYRHDLPKELVEMVDHQTLATIIRRNTDIDDEIQDNVFLSPPPEDKEEE